MSKIGRKLKVELVAPITPDLLIVKVVESDRPEDIGEIAKVMRTKPNVPLPMGSTHGSLTSLPDGGLEFNTYVPTDKIEVEDRTKQKGPSKANSAAFRRGWAETFGSLKN